jgi:transcriptional regulator with XRE-family HTH domain
MLRTVIKFMAVGDRIKRIRNMRGLTQKNLGIAIGYDESSADVRVAQYESGTRTPKEDALKKIAQALDVNYRALYDPTLYSAEDVMFTLFELDEHYSGMQIQEVIDNCNPAYPTTRLAVSFGTKILDDFLKEWQQRKKDLADGVISKAEYLEWKVNWPLTCDDGGKFEPSKEWHKE